MDDDGPQRTLNTSTSTIQIGQTFWVLMGSWNTWIGSVKNSYFRNCWFLILAMYGLDCTGCTSSTLFMDLVRNG